MPTIKSSELQAGVAINSLDRNDKTLVITHDPGGPLSVGPHTFQLVVIDDAGNRSQPATVDILVLDRTAPTAAIAAPPPPLAFGDNLTFDGSGSRDLGGEVVAWEWTLIQ